MQKPKEVRTRGFEKLWFNHKEIKPKPNNKTGYIYVKEDENGNPIYNLIDWVKLLKKHATN